MTEVLGDLTNSSAANESEPMLGPVPLLQHSLALTLVYTVFYGVVFIVGLLGNTFVVLAVLSHAQLRSTTDYLISSLAFADLLILLFCLPTTLLNSTISEWLLGAFFCKLSIWINSTTSCASIYTLVAVTADRYLAICHTMKYTLWDSKYTLFAIAGIWAVLWDAQPYSNSIYVCIAVSDGRLKFLVVNLVFAFIVPFLLIFVSYAQIFYTVSTHRSLAVDAHMRDERVKLRVATMMLTVIIVFAICWLPLYSIFTYFHFFANVHSEVFEFTSLVVRPLFQWLSLLSSAINPLIYVAYSQKYERVRGTIMRNNDRRSTSKEAKMCNELGTEAITGPSSVLIESPRSQKGAHSSSC
ncbi:unnamed protein product [Caenorhabditis auriculariae]|uniref:G-protein coupled receptors family 1 profile domain-containing protein n=1 Tax=Caenorhabditis auriculariae TaxID=2777116 RepID=A0A8S1HFC4_9PELO|nr:unnamed protein product [Caenorhabditis auriculariae]